LKSALVSSAPILNDTITMPRLRESKKARRERAEQILAILERTYPDSRIALNYETPFQLLVATILAAQCTDVRVNMVTPGLFERYPSPQAFIDAPQEELEKAVYQTGFFRNKAKAIKAASTALVLEHGGEVPRTMPELVAIPGIGRKSANVILGHCFGVPGMVVDTHVKRIANLLGLVDSEDPEKIEKALEPLFPPESWTRLGHLIQDHGREICVARRPKCEICPIAALCPSAGIAANPPAKRARARAK
jgi:endonuclease-3